VNREAVTRERVIESDLQVLGEDLLDAETGQRGYLLTLDVSYLAPYLAAKANVPKGLEALARLMVDPIAPSDLDHIRSVASAKMAELSATVDLVANGQQAEALRIVAGGSGKRLMDEFRVARKEMISREQNLVAQRRADIEKSRSRLALALLATGVAVIFAFFVYTRRALNVQQRYEASLRQATQVAQTANNAKSLFLANMSHEIRTPLNAVVGLTYLLEQTQLNSEQKGFVTQINGASKALLGVITDVLDISKIEAGELMIARVAFSPRELLKGLHAIMRTQAESKGITLELDVLDDLPGALEGDAVRLNQILTNLLSNAIKFTERGVVTLGVRQLEATSAASTLSFTVRDTGIGIEPAAQQRLFTPFVQADESITRRYGGTGLGLSIIGSLTKLMGGTVDFTSTLGVGSEFCVVLGFTRASLESLTVTQSVTVSSVECPLSNVRVLVVDDSDLNLMITQRILEQAGAQVYVAHNGQDACEKLQLQPGQFDVVLMDVQMPILDGYEATRRIRADLGLQELPIIALTAGTLSSERQCATTAGMNDFIIKPFDAATLISTVMRHTVRARIPRSESAVGPLAAIARVDWPEITGIDTGEARDRWCEDPILFRSSLERFLGEFSDMAVPLSRGEPLILVEQATRLHKLRGSAGLLGANVIQQLAAEAQAASMVGDAVLVGERLTVLAAELDSLRSSAGRAFEDAQTKYVPMAV
jgi:signal transduction histidine kinase/ActR/RegA family two-component response regulator